MALRPASIQGARLGWPGLQPGGHVDFLSWSHMSYLQLVHRHWGRKND